jgi:polyisoprenoid-binding protein YceI
MVNKMSKAGIGIFLMLLPQLLMAQSIKANESDGSLTVTGTSTLHDWEMKLSSFQASAELNKSDDNTFIIENAVFTANANDLLSDNSMMDNKAHDALESEDYPQISFHQTGTTVVPSDAKSQAKVNGKLTVAGKTNPVNITLDAVINDNQELTISGQSSLKITNFNIDPPRAMFGTIKTGDEITVAVLLKLK